jgi:hypothetical protein
MSEDDVTRIEGIGPRIAAQLHAAGIRTVAELAAAGRERVVAACGSRVATDGRVDRWLAEAARLAPRRTWRSPDRRTFTIEVRVEGTVLATRVQHVETAEEQTWAGWSRTRLLDFVEERIGVRADPPARPAGKPRVHRFGLLSAPGRAGGPEVAALLRLDPAGLDLPAGPARAAVDLLATAAGPGQAVVLDRRTLALDPDRPAETVLRGRLPDGPSPLRILAAVQVLTDGPAGPPQASLGAASLALVPA